jgi:hypothetical protein
MKSRNPQPARQFEEQLYTTNHSSKISKLSDSTIQEISWDGTHSITELLHFLHKDPIAKACVDIKCLRAANTFGVYQHTKPEITDFLQDMFGNMRDTLKKSVSELAIAPALGFSVAEINFRLDKQGYLKLESIYPLSLERVKFKGAKGYIEYVIYNDRAKSNIHIPYKKVIHVTNSAATIFNDPFGKAEAELAYPFWKAKIAVLADMIVSIKNLSTGILFAQVDSAATINATVTDAYGNPLMGRDNQPLRKNAAQVMYEKLANVENNAIIVTDKANNVTALNVSDGSPSWNFALTELNKNIHRAFGVPVLIFEEGSGSIGVATLSVKQSTLLDANIEVVVNQIQDQIIEKVCKPIIINNFGKQKDYGKFTIDSSSDPGVEMQQLQNIFTAVSMGILSGDDPVINNRIRGLLGLPLQTEQEIEEAKALKQIEQQSQMQGQAM